MVRSIVRRASVVSLSLLFLISLTFLFSSSVYAAAQRFCIVTSATTPIAQKDLPVTYTIQSTAVAGLSASIAIPATTANYKNDWPSGNPSPSLEQYCSEFIDLPRRNGHVFSFHDSGNASQQFYFVENFGGFPSLSMSLAQTLANGDGYNGGVLIQACRRNQQPPGDYAACSGRSSGARATTPGIVWSMPWYYTIFIQPSFGPLMSHGSASHKERHKESHEHKRH